MACGRRPVAPPGYHVARSFDVRVGSDSAYHIDLVEDDRLTAETRRLVVATYGENPCESMPEKIDPSVCKALAERPLRPAVVRLLTPGGQERARLTLERATADLSRLALTTRGDSATAVSVDLSAGVGSYSGPVTRFVDVDRGRLTWTVALSTDAPARELDLPTTLKTAWTVVRDGAQPEILMVSCRPDFDHPTPVQEDARFVITYTRFFRTDGAWHRVDRRVPGFWENEGPFPARTLFP